MVFYQIEMSEQIIRFDVTYTAGRRKKTEGGFEAKKAKEVLITTNKRKNNE